MAIEFVEEELVNREIEIASYLLQSFGSSKEVGIHRNLDP